MARYVSLRGWLECEHAQATVVKDIINSRHKNGSLYLMNTEKSDLYKRGWTFPNEQGGWSSYIFYGGDIQVYYLDFILDIFKEVSNIDEDVIGYLFVTEEEVESQYVYVVANGGVEKQEVNFLVR